MSFDALSWAAKQRPGSSGMKLVLLGLAECAERAHNHAFPSVASLVEFTSLDRKSVITNLSKLEAAGFIRDTTRRVGRTGQIKVYQLIIESVPKAEPSHKRNSSEKSAKGSENGTRNKSEPVSEAKASSLRVVEAWREMAKDQPQVATIRGELDHSRSQKLSRRLKEKGEAAMLEAITMIPRCPWLLGEGRDSSWRMTFDFILQPATLNKLLEGGYGVEPEKKTLSTEDRRERDMRNAAFFDRIGRADDADEIRRKWEGVVPIGDAASKILGRVAAQ